jgi:hypothetical protein
LIKEKVKGHNIFYFFFYLVVEENERSLKIMGYKSEEKRKEYAREYYQKNREKLLEDTKKRQKENPEKYKTNKYHKAPLNKYHQLVQEWREDNPTGRKCECMRELSISEHAVSKYWNLEFVIPEGCLVKTRKEIHNILEQIKREEKERQKSIIEDMAYTTCGQKTYYI